MAVLRQHERLVDDELGYVYLPTGTPTGDYYGGHRLDDNLFVESLVALDIETGERIWHSQMVHHGLWDYDNPAALNLVDVTVDGERIKAVAQVTKQGFTYVFDRATGDPVWPIEERPLPPATIPGDVASPTQPFPTKPPPFEYQGVTADDLVNFTPEIHAMAVEVVVYTQVCDLQTFHPVPCGSEGTPVYTHLERTSQPMIRLVSGDFARAGPMRRAPAGAPPPWSPTGFTDESTICSSCAARTSTRAPLRTRCGPSTASAASSASSCRGRRRWTICSSRPSTPTRSAKRRRRSNCARRCANGYGHGWACIRSSSSSPRATIPRTEFKARRVIDNRDLYRQSLDRG